ncbi:MAG: ABC transporter ATP-binding protein [Desulfobacterales bacterium]|nr:MAG: ABC transporter ATP-binding protein [Desulfobacterales bacterium]
MAFFRAENISISFGGLKALNGVSFDVRKGEIFSVIGPNGAGKTTIFNCINRFYDLDEGAFVLEDHVISKIKPHEVAEMGIARTFQNIELFKNTTVLDNLILGRHRRRRSNVFTEILFSRSVQKQELESREKAEEIIDFLDLEAYREQRVINLPYGVQKTVELGRALAMDPKLLLLDEPSSGLNVEETEDLSFWMSDIKEELGITILLVEHNMRFVQQASDRILALDFGEIITQGNPKDVLNHPEVMKAYLGEEDVFTQS